MGISFLTMAAPRLGLLAPDIVAAQQIVGPERRLRILHHHLSGESCMVSRRPVNSDVGRYQRCRTMNTGRGNFLYDTYLWHISK